MSEFSRLKDDIKKRDLADDSRVRYKGNVRIDFIYKLYLQALTYSFERCSVDIIIYLINAITFCDLLYYVSYTILFRFFIFIISYIYNFLYPRLIAALI